MIPKIIFNSPFCRQIQYRQNSCIMRLFKSRKSSDNISPLQIPTNQQRSSSLTSTSSGGKCSSSAPTTPPVHSKHFPSISSLSEHILVRHSDHNNKYEVNDYDAQHSSTLSVTAAAATSTGDNNECCGENSINKEKIDERHLSLMKGNGEWFSILFVQQFLIYHIWA